MKIKLRHCEECERETLQTKVKVCTYADGEGANYESMWYCGGCGTTWQVRTKEIDTKFTQR